jgi:hypothetical protein
LARYFDRHRSGENCGGYPEGPIRTSRNVGTVRTVGNIRKGHTVRRRISGSIFWGLVFVVFGVLVLARNIGYPIPLWTVFSRYWPVLLIVWGLFKLVDSFGAGANEKRPLFSGGDVAAIILVIVFGSLVTLTANMNPDFGKLFNIHDLDVWDLTGNNFTFTEQQVAETGPNPVIEVAENFGDVEVMPGEGSRITLDVKKTIRAANQAEADRLSSGSVYSISNNGPDGVVKFRIASSSNRRFKASLSIHVPPHSIVTIENRNGNVSVRGLTGNQEITNRFGDVELHGITGMVKIQNRNGSVRVDDVSDSVTIDNSFGPINVANVRGELKISGRNNEIDIDHVEKDLDVESAFQNVDIRDPMAGVNVRSRNGEISVHLLHKPAQNISVDSQFGDVTIDIPSGSVFSADVSVRNGSIDSDYSELQSTSHNANHSLNGQVGTGGPNIKVDSRFGQVRLTKRG